MKLLKKLINIFDRTNDVFALLAIAFLVFMMLIINGEVITRVSLGGSLKWVIEVTEYSMVYMVFLATAWLLRSDGHVKVELLLNVLKPRNHTLVNTITSVAAAIACLVVAFYSAQFTWDNFQDHTTVTSLLRPPKWTILAIIPVGCFLLFIQFARRSYSYLQRLRAPSDQEHHS